MVAGVTQQPLVENRAGTGFLTVGPATYVCLEHSCIMLLNSEPLAEDLGKLLLRVGAGGLMFMEHGWSKLATFAERLDSFADPIGLGPAASLVLVVFAEAICSVLVVLGLWTRLSTIPLIIAMGVAAFISNSQDPFGDGESALMYMIAFLSVLLAGSGRFSIDRLSFR